MPQTNLPPSFKLYYGIFTVHRGGISKTIILISTRIHPWRVVKFFWREISNKCHCGNVLTLPKVKNKRTEFAAVAQLGEVDRNIILPGTLSVIGFSHFHSQIAKGFFSTK